MTYVISSACVGVKDGVCVEVCPVDCIHPHLDSSEAASAEQLFIDPKVCIDCGVCEMECPVGAIFRDRDLPVAEGSALARNADYFGLEPAEFRRRWMSVPEAVPGSTVKEVETRLGE